MEKEKSSHKRSKQGDGILGRVLPVENVMEQCHRLSWLSLKNLYTKRWWQHHVLVCMHGWCLIVTVWCCNAMLTMGLSSTDSMKFCAPASPDISAAWEGEESGAYANSVKWNEGDTR